MFQYIENSADLPIDQQSQISFLIRKLVSVWMRLQYTHRGTHYEHMLNRRHGIGINVKELIVALVTEADAMSAALACF
jgi:hypothetical protein